MLAISSLVHPKVPDDSMAVRYFVDQADHIANGKRITFIAAHYSILTDLVNAVALSAINVPIYTGLGTLKCLKNVVYMQFRKGAGEFSHSLSDAGASLKVALLGLGLILGAVFAPRRVARFVANAQIDSTSGSQKKRPRNINQDAIKEARWLRTEIEKERKASQQLKQELETSKTDSKMYEDLANKYYAESNEAKTANENMQTELAKEKELRAEAEKTKEFLQNEITKIRKENEEIKSENKKLNQGLDVITQDLHAYQKRLDGLWNKIPQIVGLEKALQEVTENHPLPSEQVEQQQVENQPNGHTNSHEKAE